MKKTITSILFLLIIGALQGCAIKNAIVDTIDSFDCPTPSKDQLNKDGYLIMQNGVTLKCQVQKNTSKMSCVGVTDSNNADGLVCQSGKNQAIFLFDENGILTAHKFGKVD